MMWDDFVYCRCNKRSCNVYVCGYEEFLGCVYVAMFWRCGASM